MQQSLFSIPIQFVFLPMLWLFRIFRLPKTFPLLNISPKLFAFWILDYSPIYNSFQVFHFHHFLSSPSILSLLEHPFIQVFGNGSLCIHQSLDFEESEMIEVDVLLRHSHSSASLLLTLFVIVQDISFMIDFYLPYCSSFITRE